jgi:hypothetical protein
VVIEEIRKEIKNNGRRGIKENDGGREINYDKL